MSNPFSVSFLWFSYPCNKQKKYDLCDVLSHEYALLEDPSPLVSSTVVPVGVGNAVLSEGKSLRSAVFRDPHGTEFGRLYQETRLQNGLHTFRDEERRQSENVGV